MILKHVLFVLILYLCGSIHFFFSQEIVLSNSISCNFSSLYLGYSVGWSIGYQSFLIGSDSRRFRPSSENFPIDFDQSRAKSQESAVEFVFGRSVSDQSEIRVLELNMKSTKFRPLSENFFRSNYYDFDCIRKKPESTFIFTPNYTLRDKSMIYFGHISIISMQILKIHSWIGSLFS